MTESPNIDHLRSTAKALGDLVEQFVFLGGCVVELLITDKGAASARPTRDVDSLVQVTSTHEWQKIQDGLRMRGFSEDPNADHMHRWRKDELLLDALPINTRISGVRSPWWDLVVETDQLTQLGGDLRARIISGPCFVATKLDAFENRGQQDYLGSPDLEDFVAVLDGRPSIVREISAFESSLRVYVADQAAKLMGTPAFIDALPGHLDTRSRSPIIRKRLKALAELNSAE